MEEPEGKKVNRARGERNGERQSRKEEMEADRHVERWVGQSEIRTHTKNSLKRLN